LSERRASLDARVLDWMREAEPAHDEVRFEALALDLFRFQFEHCPPYGRFCARRGRTPSSVRSWREIPAVPTGAFKEVALRSFPAERAVRVFRTSGTSTDRPGTLWLDTLALYEASLGYGFERFVLPEWHGREGRLRVLVLQASPDEAPHSSLSHMFGAVLARRGDDQSGFLVGAGVLDRREALHALEAAAAEGAALALCGTAFAFVHLLDALRKEGRSLALPAATRVMETGGFKGRARERPREALYAEIEERLGVPPGRIVNQYGMTELGSQFYDTVLALPGPRRKHGPPWARVRIVDPLRGEPCGPGEVGAIEIVDLANTGSVAAIQTADLGRTVSDGFDVLGRAPDAEARGCSIAADEMLGAGG
jgi:hypothetical protein